MEVIKDYKAEIPETPRFELNAGFLPSDTSGRKQKYNLLLRPFEVSYITPNLKPLKMISEENPENYPGFLSLGFGLPLNRDQEVPKLVARMGYKGAGSGDPAAQLGAQIKILEELLRWGNQLGEQVMMLQFGRYGVPPKEALIREIEQRRKQLAEIKRQQRDAGNGN